MQIQINSGDIHPSDRVLESIHEELGDATRLFHEQVTRLEVHLHDLNGSKPGGPIRCTIECRLAGHKPLAVEHDAEKLNEAVTGASGKLERAVRHLLDRHADH